MSRIFRSTWMILRRQRGLACRDPHPRASMSSARPRQYRGASMFHYGARDPRIPPLSPSLQHIDSLFPKTRRFASTSDPPTRTTRKRRKFVPRKAAVELTDQARTFFKALLEKSPHKDGIVLNYQQASSGQPRMVFTFGFVSKEELTVEDEGVSLEVMEDGTPKPPKDSVEDGLQKLYIHHNAFLKVLGATLDVDTETISPILYDREGNQIDPNV